MKSLVLSALALALSSAPAWAGPFLLMAEEAGCYWCQQWDEEIAEIYPKTAEGKKAPLRRFDIHDTPPVDVTFAEPVRYTPTFILVDEGREIDRIEGYPGEDFFWGLLGVMLERAGVTVGNTG